MGKGASNYMLGSSVFYDELGELRNWTHTLIDENGIDPLPDLAFPFWIGLR